MMHCPRCDISFTGALDACPLCGDTLTGIPSPSPFPYNALMKKSKRARLWLAGITLVCMLVTMTIGIGTQASVLATAAACCAILLNYLFMRNAIVHSPNLLRMVERYFLVLLAVMVLLFVATEQDAITTFVIPALCLIATISNTVLVIIFRDAFVQSYGKYLIYDLVLGFAPLIFWVLGFIWWPWLAVASAAMSGALLAVLIIFTRRQATSEMRKLFNA